MVKKILILIILFYFLALLQTSFLVHFRIIPNLILILVILWSIFEKPKNYYGISNALIGGFFLDIFSSRPIGFYIFLFLALAILLKIIVKKHVRIPFLERA